VADDAIVAGRVCGTCTVCCSILPIDTPDLAKMPGVLCAKCTGTGCSIREGWPPICRDYFCGWRMLAEFDDAWRPDRSGILITPISEGVPERFSLRQGIEFMVVDRERALAGDRLVATIFQFVVREIAAWLAIPGPAGHYATRVLLNDAIAGEARKNERELATKTIVRILDSARTHRFEPVVLKFAASR
jgi:hypothetical protein